MFNNVPYTGIVLKTFPLENEQTFVSVTINIDFSSTMATESVSALAKQLDVANSNEGGPPQIIPGTISLKVFQPSGNPTGTHHVQ